MTIRLEYIERLHLGLLAAAGVLAYATAWCSPWSLLLGGAVMAANVWLLRQLASRLLMPKRRPWLVLVLLVAKFCLFMGLLALLFWRAPLDPMGFAAGATMWMVACVAAVLGQGFRAAPSNLSGGVLSKE